MLHRAYQVTIPCGKKITTAAALNGEFQTYSALFDGNAGDGWTATLDTTKLTAGKAYKLCTDPWPDRKCF